MSGTLLHTFLQRAELQTHEVALRELRAGGAPRDVALTWGEWAHRSRSFARALHQAGCRPGDTVAVLAGNSLAWPIADLGGLMAGAITVGLYPSSAPVQVHAILNDCAARVLVVDTAAQLEKVRAVRSGLPALQTIVCLEDGEGTESFERWTRGPAIDEIFQPTPEQIALLIYTSGSTGEPKGARISHAYLRASAESIAATLSLSAQDSSLSFLPFSHAAERIFGLYTRIHCGMTAGLIADHTKVWEAARSFEPTLFGGLPRFYEKLYTDLAQIPPDARRERLSGLVGRRVRIATSGGATVASEIVHFLAQCGLDVLGAYGLTEHLCVAMHRPGVEARERAESVGRAMPGTDIRISDSGEVLIRTSPLTFSGYHNQPAQTRAAFTEDGEWLRTGDLGRIDADGFLYITGREKELIALSTGKKVAPLPIEARLLNSSLISQAVLVGENRKFIGALLCLRPAALAAWCAQRSLRLSHEEAAAHPELQALVQAEIDRVNEDLSNSERIRRFAVLPRELSLDRDELTPTLKVRRAVITERYREVLDSLYQVSA